MRLQAGDEVHVVLRQHFQQRVERLAELGIVLHGDEGTWRYRLTYRDKLVASMAYGLNLNLSVNILEGHCEGWTAGV